MLRKIGGRKVEQGGVCVESHSCGFLGTINFIPRTIPFSLLSPAFVCAQLSRRGKKIVAFILAPCALAVILTMEFYSQTPASQRQPSKVRNPLGREAEGGVTPDPVAGGLPSLQQTQLDS